MEAWRLGGATEVEARAAALGDDETERCAAITVQARSDKPSTAKHDAGGGPCVRKGARPARRACRGMAGFARHALVFWKSSGGAPQD